MASRIPAQPTLRAQRFIEANAKSPLTYMSTDGDGCTCSLADGTRFELSTADCLSMRAHEPRWRHLCGVGV
jgi:hypothetical protein